MSNNISSLLHSLYMGDQAAASFEKTAEDHLLAALRDQGQVAENPYATMSTEDLIKIAQELENGPAEADATPELLEKTAAEMLGGQVMAHAMVHEFSLIKEAMSQGLCRVCKEAPMDTQGASICSGCLSATDE